MRTRIDIASYVRLTELADYIVPFALRVVCDLGVADHLVDGPLSVDRLAESTGSHASSLRRVMRALACRGIFTEVSEDRFALTPLAEPLRSDHPLSLREAYPLLPGDVKAWAHFDHSVRTGEPAFDQAHGQSYWDYLAQRPDELRAFNASQQAATRLELRTLLPAYDWGSLETVVDVGGGNGAFLAGLLAKFPRLHGTLLDQPDMAAQAHEVLAAAEVAGRCEVVGGSFFDEVPPGADAYLLKRILYGWDDERAVQLLRTVAAAMKPRSRLLVLEPVRKPGNEFDVGKTYDLLLFAMAGGRVRGADEIGALCARAGLRVERVVDTMMLPIVEVRTEETQG
ncbi:MAG: tcmN1 [Nonomuraea muscovyensis]|nr:tcmN1 [Nonomuraea muscovyensis]